MRQRLVRGGAVVLVLVGLAWSHYQTYTWGREGTAAKKVGEIVMQCYMKRQDLQRKVDDERAKTKQCIDHIEAFLGAVEITQCWCLTPGREGDPSSVTPAPVCSGADVPVSPWLDPEMRVCRASTFDISVGSVRTVPHMGP